ncbi:MAG: EAL domain-containing protein [Desulfotomaculaceae bacterium]
MANKCRNQAVLQSSEDRYRTLFESMIEGFALHEIILDPNGKPCDYRFLELNQAFEVSTGLNASDVLGKTVLEVLPQTEPYWIEIYGEVAQSGKPKRFQNYSQTLDKYFDVHVFSPQPGQFATIFIDITENRRSQEALKESEARLARVVATVPVGITITSTSGTITFANATAEKILRLEQGAISKRAYNDPTWKIIREDGSPMSDAELPFSRVMRTQEPVWGVEQIIEHQDSSITILSINAAPLFDSLGGITGVVASIRDITEHKQMQKRLLYLATNDYLTKVPNRYYLEKKLNKTVEAAKLGQKSALLFLDVDNFKMVNDIFGHSAGDQLLVKITSIVKDNLRPTDLLARIGGDEFAVLLDGVTEAEASVVAEKIRHSLDNQDLILNSFTNILNLSVSIGVVMIDGFYESNRLLSIADMALHGAKERGRNRVVFTEPGSDDSAKLTKINDLMHLIKRAPKENQLIMHFQPILAISAGKKEISHFEGLVRLKDYNGEIIPPQDFIPVAENFNLMPQIDRWVASHAVETLQKYPGTNIFINISGLSLEDEELLIFIERQIIGSGINPARLGFEITETAAVKNFLHAQRWIRKLKGVGCKFSLDDFGIGFSSFSYLVNLPVDYLKIDGSFIKNIDSDPTHRALVQAMHAIAHTLGKKTIAEFIENAAVLQILKELEIDYGQGCLLGRPGPIEGWYK